MSASRDIALDRLRAQATPRLEPAMAWLWALLVAAGSAGLAVMYWAHMEPIDLGIQAAATAALAAGGWWWKALRSLTVAVCALVGAALWRYGGSLSAADTDPLLGYFLASQSSLMWMSALFVAATLAYGAGLLAGSSFSARAGTALAWAATAFGLAGLLVRWHESYLMGADIGHIPISNLYEVFILFAVVTALLYLYYEQRFRNRAMGAFVLLVISAAVGFLLWYTFEREAHEIQPLVPALQSYWMKIHVPANFVGYGCFAIAAMLGVAYLVRRRADRVAPGGRITEALPGLALLEEVMYRAIALGFAAFTVATILGALWAAEAWGGYWSWDPKETWALIVWLNYAAWLHMRLTKGWRGTPMAWWSVAGLLVTLFAFLGVNMFLSGLHSYGTL